MQIFSHLNSVDLDSEMETISFSEDLPSPMSLVHVAHLLRPSASFPGPHPAPVACSTSGRGPGTFSHVSDIMGRKTLIECRQA